MTLISYVAAVTATCPGILRPPTDLDKPASPYRSPCKNDKSGQNLLRMAFAPAFASGSMDDVISVQLRLVGDTDLETHVIAVEAILAWDQSKIELLGASQEDAEDNWFVTGFLDDPDGINDPGGSAFENDGNALFTALAPPDSPVAVDANGTTVTTLHFRLLETPSNDSVTILPSLGMFGVTRILGVDPGRNVVDPELPQLKLWPPTAVPAVGTWSLCCLLMGMISITSLMTIRHTARNQ
ncbi:MAG: hypothetical protein ACPGXK_06320 [Phycisphaerae bacterium]